VPYIRETCLYHSGLLTIRDVRCRCPRGHVSGSEQSSASQLIFTRRGFFVCEAAGATMIGSPNHVLIFTQGEEFRAVHPVDGGDECTAIALAEELWEEAVIAPVGMLVGRWRERCRSLALSPQVQLRSAALHAHLRSGSLSDLEAEAAAMELIRSAGVSHLASPETVGRTRSLQARRRVTRAIVHMADHLGSPVTLKDVAAAVHCSPYHLTTLFRDLTGYSLCRYHRQWRLASALADIVSHDLPLGSLAYLHGFSSASHLTNVARSAFGITPRQVRSLGRRRVT